MSRFAATLGWELRIQARQGIYYAAAVVVLVWVAVLFALPAAARALLLPFALFMDVSVFGVFLMAGMLFLEKGDRVLQALVVTPVPRGSYLLTKLASLTIVGTLALSGADACRARRARRQLAHVDCWHRTQWLADDACRLHPRHSLRVDQRFHRALCYLLRTQPAASARLLWHLAELAHLPDTHATRYAADWRRVSGLGDVANCLRTCLLNGRLYLRIMVGATCL